MRRPDYDVETLTYSHGRLIGTTFGMRTHDEGGAVAERIRQEIVPALGTASLKPVGR